MSSHQRRDKSFPHKEVASALSVAAIGYCIYSLWSLVLQQRSDYLQKQLDDLEKEQEELNKPPQHDQNGLPGLQLDIPYNQREQIYDDGYGSPFFGANEAVAADLIDTAPLSPLHKPSSRMSIASQPASPQTHSVINKLDSLNGFRLWTKLDPTGSGRVSKHVVIEQLQRMGELLLFVDTIGNTESPEEILERAVSKIAGANNEFVSKQRWEKYLKDGRIDLQHVDNVD